MDENRYMVGRDGDILTSPFQCDLYWFRNLKGRDPIDSSMSDSSLLVYIRRVNLDMMWSSAPGTVSSTKGNISEIVQGYGD